MLSSNITSPVQGSQSLLVTFTDTFKIHNVDIKDEDTLDMVT